MRVASSEQRGGEGPRRYLASHFGPGKAGSSGKLLLSSRTDRRLLLIPHDPPPHDTPGAFARGLRNRTLQSRRVRGDLDRLSLYSSLQNQYVNRQLNTIEPHSQATIQIHKQRIFSTSRVPKPKTWGAMVSKGEVWVYGRRPSRGGDTIVWKWEGPQAESSGIGIHLRL